MPQPLSKCSINFEAPGATVVGSSGIPARNMVSGIPIKFAICNACDYPLELRPELLAGAMRVISAWSVLESHLHRVFVSLLRGNPEQAIAMFLKLESTSAQRQVLSAAAEVALSATHIELLRAILEIYKKKQRARNRVAHHLWGYSDLILDGILLMDPRDYLVWQSASGTPLPAEKIFVYRHSDFVEIVDSIERLSSMLHDFYFMIGPHAHRGDELFQQLSSLPDVRSALDRLRRRQYNHQEVPQ